MAFNYEYPYVDPHRYNADWLLKFAKEAKDKLEAYKKTLDELHQTDDELQTQIDTINAYINNWDQHAAEAIQKWIATMIFVEISDSGYIIYNIPEAWKDITFNTTGLDIELALQPDYGHLVLSY